MSENRPLPGWPRGLREEFAAAYVGMSESLFRRECAAGRAPAAVRLTPGRLVWLREDLDAYLDRLAGRQQHPARRGDALAAEWDKALGDETPGVGRGSALP